MEFFQQFGIDTWLIYAQIINFVVLLVILVHFLYNPLLKRLEEEEQKRKAAEAARQKADQELEQKQTQLVAEETRVRAEARKIIAQAQDIAEDIKRRAAVETLQEKKAVIEQLTSQFPSRNEKQTKTAH